MDQPALRELGSSSLGVTTLLHTLLCHPYLLSCPTSLRL